MAGIANRMGSNRAFGKNKRPAEQQPPIEMTVRGGGLNLSLKPPGWPGCLTNIALQSLAKFAGTKHFTTPDKKTNLSKLKTYFNWSTGKDAALALHYLLQDKNYSVEHLLTAVNSFHDRVSMYGLRRSLLQQQVAALGIAHSSIELPEQPSMPEYEHVMKQAVLHLHAEGFTHAAFGDIFLADLRKYRDEQLAAMNIKTVFPIWKRNSKELLQEFIGLGFKAVLVCINANLLDPSFAGRVIDAAFINDLPAHVDPCGENGEFHSFCFDGPIFKHPIPFTIGEKVYREYKAPTASGEVKETGLPTNMGFWFCDLLPVTEISPAADEQQLTNLK